MLSLCLDQRQTLHLFYGVSDLNPRGTALSACFYCTDIDCKHMRAPLCLYNRLSTAAWMGIFVPFTSKLINKKKHRHSGRPHTARTAPQCVFSASETENVCVPRVTEENGCNWCAKTQIALSVMLWLSVFLCVMYQWHLQSFPEVRHLPPSTAEPKHTHTNMHRSSWSEAIRKSDLFTWQEVRG